MVNMYPISNIISLLSSIFFTSGSSWLEELHSSFNIWKYKPYFSLSGGKKPEVVLPFKVSVFCRWIESVPGWPSRFRPLATGSEIVPDDHFRSHTATWKMLETESYDNKQIEFVEKRSPTHRLLLQNDILGYSFYFIYLLTNAHKN